MHAAELKTAFQSAAALVLSLALADCAAQTAKDVAVAARQTAVEARMKVNLVAHEQIIKGCRPPARTLASVGLNRCDIAEGNTMMLSMSMQGGHQGKS